MTKTTPIVLTTHTLSKGVDAITARQTSTGKALDKGAMLHLLAQTIAGPKHSWGYLTGHTGTVVARDAQRFASATTPDHTPDRLYFYTCDERDTWSNGMVGPFTSRAHLLEALAKDTFWHTPDFPVHEVINALATGNSFVFYEDGEGMDEDDGDAAPYAIHIHTFPVPAPADPILMPIIGYQIEDGCDHYEDDDNNAPASFELFTTFEAAERYLATITPSRPNLRVCAVRAGDVENPSWI